MAKYKIDNTTILTDSGGRTLVSNDITASGTITVTNTIKTLSPTYFTDYFPAAPIQGSTSGYTSAGQTSGSGKVNTIDKFPFSSDANATDVGDLTEARAFLAGQSSSASGYTSGGNTDGSGMRNTIDKFPFAVDANATDVGDLTELKNQTAGQSSSTHGYNTGGLVPDQSPGLGNTIDKFTFSSDANATDVGNLFNARYDAGGTNSTTHGYTAGGINPGTTNIIDKFPFSSDINATDMGDLSQARSGSRGQFSSTHGYYSGGRVSPSTRSNVIDKFPFATDANSTDVGNLTQTRERGSGQSSTESGYTSGGTNPPPASAYYNTIDKFPFAVDANATDVGDLTGQRSGLAGQQV